MVARECEQNGKLRFRLSVLSWLVLLLLTGCAAPGKVDTSKLIWPPPPDEPRIRYVATYSNQKDLNPGSRLKAILLGEDPAGLGLQKPYGVSATADGKRIYVTDTKLGAVLVFDLEAKTVKPFETDSLSSLISPIEARLDDAGNVYVSDSVQNVVNVYSPEGKTLLSLGKPEKIQRPTGLAVDTARSRLYVADTKGHCILVYGLDGKFLKRMGERGSAPGEFNFPVNLALGPKGNLYVVDSGNFRVQVLAPDGAFVREFGKPGDGFGSMARPKGIALDSEGHIYVADAAFNNFQIFDQEGKILMFVGSLGRAPGQFWIPTGMYIDRHDKLYVVDAVNARVQVFQYLKGAEAAESAPAAEQG